MKILIILTLLFLTKTAFAEVSAPISGTLSNGLDYTILPLHDEKGRMEIRLRVEAGSVDESETQAGVAHMVEHLVFRASDKHPNGVMTHLHNLNLMRGKHYNAVTTSDSTTYMLLPSPNMGLDESLSTLSQMMFFAHLTQEDLDKERAIIMEEWRGGQGVAARMDEQRKAVVRADSRYVRNAVIGTESSITNMPASELQDFYHTWYAPNNMNLLIVGDVDISAAVSQIDQYFGQIPAKPLPDRTGDYYDIRLSDKLTIAELHDDRSGVSQVAYILRFDESGSRGDSDIARKNRLIDRFALTFITKRLQNEMPYLPDGIKSMVARKSDLGKNTSALGLFSSVDKDKHQDGLQEIFYQIKRLYDYPITQAELDEYKQDLQAQIDKAHTHANDRDFSGWVQAMMGTVLIDKPYLTQNEIANLTQPILDSLTTQDVQQRVHEWLSAGDRIVQYQAPHTFRVSPMTDNDIQAMMDKAHATTLLAPTPKTVVTPIELPDVITTAHIAKVTRHGKEGNIHTYTLSTGDKVVWLTHPSAGDKIYIRAISDAGIKTTNVNAWQSQIATQLMIQNTPYHFNKEQWNDFKKTHKLNLSAKQNSHELVVEISSDAKNLNELISLYHAQMYHTTIKEGLSEVKVLMENELMPKNTHKQAEQNRHHELSKLRQLPTMLPTREELNAISEADLNHTWQKLTAMPVTFYVVSQADPATMGQFIPLLARPQTSPSLSFHSLTSTPESFDSTPLAKSATIKFPHHQEWRADVQLWTNTPHTWQGVDAMSVSLLKTIASDKLKLTLRDEKLGIYRLQFDSILNTHTNLVESHLKFTTSPDKVDEMIEATKEVLSNLSNLITEDDVAKAKATLSLQEKSRQSDPYTHLNRLILSDKQNNDFDYLTQSAALTDKVTLNNLKRMADKLYNANSVQVWVDMPKGE